MPCNLAAFDLPERLRCSRGIAKAVKGATSVESAARSLCRFFYDELVDASGDRACALVRLYMTQPFARIPDELKDFARKAASGAQISPDTRCLVLLGTSGLETEWNSRRSSKGHQAIPLVSAEMVEKAPMIAQLIKAFGLKVSDVVSGSASVVRDLGGKSYGVFYVPDASGSPFIPAQDDFVLPHRIKSVVGCGGEHASGELFAIVLFSRIHVSSESAERFRALALDAKAALLAFSDEEVFEATA